MPMFLEFWLPTFVLSSICVQATGTIPGHDTHHALQLFPVSRARVSPAPQTILLTANVTVLRKSGEWVEVQWQNVPEPSRDDLVALYVPADAEPGETSPAKYQFAYKSDSHLLEGRGSLRFRLINYRADLRFAFIRDGLQYPDVVAWSGVITVDNPNEPAHGHMSLTGKPREVVIQWTSRDSVRARVKWGWNSGIYIHRSEANTTTYGRADLCGPPATTLGWHEPGQLHAALLSGLTPGKKYYYRFGEEEYGWSAEYSFVGPPDAGHDAAVKLLAVADLGQAEVDASNEFWEQIEALDTVRHMIQDSDYHHLLVHNGDISYACGYGTQWDVYMEMMEPLLTRLPYMTVIGNHERDWPDTGDRFTAGVRDSGGECGVPFERRIQMPLSAPDKPWYSYDFGPVHMLQYSTEHPFGEGSEQRAFIAADLAGVDRGKTPWLVVNGHRPIYIDSTYDGPQDSDQVVAQELRGSLEELLAAYSVDLTLHGHHHSYQRSCPLLSGECVGYGPGGVAQAPVHVVMGHAGAPLTFNVRPQPQPFWELVRLEHGYLRISANATTFDVQVVRSSNGTVMDAFALRKPYDWKPRDPAAFPTWRPDRHAAGGRQGGLWQGGLLPALQAAARLALRAGMSLRSASWLTWGLAHDHMEAHMALRAPQLN